MDYKIPAALSSASPKALRSPDSDSDEEFTFSGENVTVSKNPAYVQVQQRQASVVKGAMPTDFTKAQTEGPALSSSGALSTAGPMLVKVTPYIPSKNPNRIRERSQRVLDSLRAEETERTGQPPRLVYDEETGFLLPRDQIVQYEDAPAAGSNRAARAHYKRSLEIMQELKEERMMRHFEGM